MKFLTTNKTYPFEYFTEEAFYAKQVMGYVYNNYEEALDQYGFPIVSVGEVSRVDGSHLFKKAAVARICMLGEDYPNPLFGGSGYSDEIRRGFDALNGDVEEVASLIDIFPISQSCQEVYTRDLSRALNMMNVFHLHSSLDYRSLGFFSSMDNGEAHPYSKESKDKILINTPITGVW